MCILNLFTSFRKLGFLFVGGFVFVAQFIGNVYCVTSVGWDKQVAYAIVGIIAVEVNFFLNKYLNWRDRPGSLWDQYRWFHYLRLSTYALNQGLFAWQLDEAESLGYLKLNALLSLLELALHFLWGEFVAFRKNHVS